MASPPPRPDRPVRPLRPVRLRGLPGRIALGGIALALPALASCVADEPERPQHVLLIVIDTLRADHVGALGDWEQRDVGPSPTPAIDALARRGAVFERAIAQSSWTSPSMVSLMTGRRVRGDRLSVPLANPEDPANTKLAESERARIPTMATSFREHGWSTAAFICNDFVGAKYGFAGGFDVFEQHTPYVGFEEAIAKWFQRHAHERTFTYVHLNEPHDPYRPPAGVRYPDDWKELWQEHPPAIPAERRRYYEEQRARFALPPIDGDVEEIALESARYIDDARFADENVRRILAALEERGLLADTLVVLTADHGEGLWTRPAFASGDRGHEQLHDRKQPVPEGQPRPKEPPTLWNTLKVTHGNQVYTELTRVPLIVAGRGAPTGRFDVVVENVDIWPTLLEILDFEAPTQLDGRSLWGAARNSSEWRRDKPVAFSATRYNKTVLDHDGWQLIEPSELGDCLEGLENELYDLVRDPEARHNVAAERPDVVERLAPQLTALSEAALPQKFTMEDIEESASDLTRLGYVGQMTDGVKAARLHSTEELFETLNSTSALDCLERYWAAKVVVERRAELSGDQLEAVKALLTKEQPAAVRSELKQLFE